MRIYHFKDLSIWKDSIVLTKDIYQLTSKFPRSETYSLVDQIRRASASVGANIAEGFGRYSQKEKIHYYFLSRGSLFEVEHFLYLAIELKYLSNEEGDVLITRCEMLMRSLQAYGTQLKNYQKGITKEDN